MPIDPQLPARRQASPENPLDTELKKKSDKDASQIYSEKEKPYANFLQARLERVRTMNDGAFPEFNGMTRLERFEKNEQVANTNHLAPKTDPDEVTVSAGIIEQKLDALLSHINNLNLEPDILAFDKEDNEVAALGRALEDIIFQTKIQEGADGAGDEEKKLQRQRQLLKQPAVFVMEEWSRRWEMRKTLRNKNFDPSKLAEFEGFTEALELVFEGPSSELLYMPNVYLGDMTEFYMDNQPDMFVRIQTDYKNARARYGKFERFKHVKPGKVAGAVDNESRTIFDNKWRLIEVADNSVEIIMYYCKERDEFQIIINGVMMLPIGFPLSAVVPGGGYNVVKQVFRIINSHFAYGKAFVEAGSVQQLSALIDEMLKLFILKERKSITPAYINTSNRVIKRSSLNPGRISMGIEPNSLVPIETTNAGGITQGEAAVFEKYEELLNKSTVSEQFTGQQGKSGTTATETIEVSRQARLTLGLAITACTLLEKKLTYLRLNNIIANWFSPTGEKIEEIEGVRTKLKKFRKSTRTTSLKDSGVGERSVILVDGPVPSGKEIRQMEFERGDRLQKPVEIIFIQAPKMPSAKVTWYVVINPRERENSPFFKLLFRELLNDVTAMMNLGSSPNLEGLEKRFGQAWEGPSNEFFSGRLNRQELANLAGTPSESPTPESTPSPVPQPAATPAANLPASGGL